jgi:beta-lactamase class D
MFVRGAALAAGAGIIGFPRISDASAETGIRATLVADAATGKALHRSGACASRFSPCSTFKIPLALMGFDSGILKDAHHPAWDYRPEVHHANREVEKHRTDPSSWEINSVVWYSQQLTAQMGAAKFKAYVDRFGYGNRDVTGNPGKRDGLTQAWLMSSLAISPDEQVAFLRRMLAHRLPVSAAAHRMAEAIVPEFDGADDWTLRGKTGSGWMRNRDGTTNNSWPIGWFVGWADKGKRRVVFARFGGGTAVTDPRASGFSMRELMRREIGRLTG